MDRLTRLEGSQKDTQKQVDRLRAYVLQGFGILFGSMVVLTGFVIWSRGRAGRPVSGNIRKTRKW